MELLKDNKSTNFNSMFSTDSLSINKSEKNQLACVMFTDVVGSTRLMEQDQQQALEILSQNAAMQNSEVIRAGGTVVKELGDGILATFSSATDAVSCAERIMQKAQKIDCLELRIGIHLGEVIFTEKDVFGMVVNIASRLQTLAKKGQILVSESVANMVRRSNGICTELMGLRKLKNVKNRMTVYSIVHENSNYQRQNNWIIENVRLNVQRAVAIVVMFMANGIS